MANATERFEAFLSTHTPKGGFGSHDEAWEAWERYEERVRASAIKIAASYGEEWEELSDEEVAAYLDRARGVTA